MTSCSGVQLAEKENATSAVDSSSLEDCIQIEGESRKTQVKKAGRSRARLDANGDNILEVSWKQRYQQLVEYASEHGDCLVSRSYHDKKLYNWVILQRQEFKKWRQGKRSNLSVERKNALEKIGFVWRMKMLPKAVCWDTRFEELCAYKQEHGNTLVPQKYRPNVQLGRWYVFLCVVEIVCLFRMLRIKMFLCFTFNFLLGLRRREDNSNFWKWETPII
jgi:hypothetical protein